MLHIPYICLLIIFQNTSTTFIVTGMFSEGEFTLTTYSCSSQYLVCLVKPGSSPDLFPVRAFTRTFVIMPIDTKRYYTLYTTSHKFIRSYSVLRSEIGSFSRPRIQCMRALSNNVLR